jgi:hypothetical protein
MPIPVAVRSKAYIFSRLFSGITDLNPDEGMDIRFFVLVVCCVGSCLCDELITPSEKSYPVYMCLCVI